jgi:hypothetical protein
MMMSIYAKNALIFYSWMYTPHTLTSIFESHNLGKENFEITTVDNYKNNF